MMSGHRDAYSVLEACVLNKHQECEYRLITIQYLFVRLLAFHQTRHFGVRGCGLMNIN